MAAAHASTTVASRPSDTFGTISNSADGTALPQRRFDRRRDVAHGFGAGDASARGDTGAMMRVNPSFRASLTRRAVCDTARTSPERPSSPKAIVCASSAVPRNAEAIASAMPRSAAGSLTRKPPATDAYTSCPPSCSPARRSSTAMIIASRAWSRFAASRRGVP